MAGSRRGSTESVRARPARAIRRRGARVLAEALEARRLLSYGPDAYGYVAAAHPFEALDLIPGASGVTSILDSADDDAVAIPLGSNTFTFYGVSHTGNSALWVSTNGLITFGTPEPDFSNTNLTLKPAQRAIAPFWDDLVTNKVTGSGAENDQVLYQFDGNRLIIEWSQIRQYSTSAPLPGTFQAILELNTGGAPGAITFNYVDLEFGSSLYDNGASATIGIKDAGEQGARRLLISHNDGSNPLIASGQAIRISALVGDVSGIKYEDRNANGQRDAGEPGLSGWTIYVDANNNGLLDDGERYAITDADGAWSISGLPVGSHVVRELVQPGWIQVTPPAATGGGGAGGASGSVAVGSASPQEALALGIPADRIFTRTEIIASVRGKTPMADLAKLLAGKEGAKLRPMINPGASRVLLPGERSSLLELKLRPGVDPLKAMVELQKLALVEWATPNFVYKGDPRELVPNDPLYSSQYHHTRMQNHLAWDVTQGAGVILAITDDGVDWSHPDLADAIWINPGEIPGNGIDDDGNGYVDDVRGWDFIGNDNDPSPSTTDVHGTHVMGIAGARTNNAVGIAGTAGQVTIMPLRFYSSTMPFTSALVANAYGYAVDNGARIISTSYNVDQFVGDLTFFSALSYVYEAGALHFNSAGNTNTLNPARQQYDHSLYVASTDNSDVRSGFSNHGWGIDLSAPGTNILSTLPDSQYGTASGTSMAAPNAAAVAALIWSANPTWTREQVAAQLLGTSDNVDAQNPAYAGLLGAGRVNAYRAVTQTIAAPRFRGLLGLPGEGSEIYVSPTSFAVEVASVFAPGTIHNPANWSLVGAGEDGLFDTADDVTIPITLVTNYMVGTNRVNFTVDGTMLPDLYRFRALSGGLTNPFGTPLDGNGNGAGGDDFVRTFRLGVPSNAAIVTVLNQETTGDVAFGSFPNVFTGSAAPDTYAVAATAAGVIEIVANGVSYSIARDLLPSLTIHGQGGDDLVTVDWSDGAPAKGLIFNGGGGNDRLHVAIGAHTGLGATPGVVSYLDQSISYAGVERLRLTGGGGTIAGDHANLNLDLGLGVAVVQTTQRLNRLEILTDARVELSSGDDIVLRTRELVMGEGAVLDVGDEDLVVDYAGHSPVGTWNGSAYDGVAGLIASGAIISSAATMITGLGVAEASDALGISAFETALFSGETVDGSSVLVKYTYTGDANLDGQLNIDDYGQIDFYVGLSGVVFGFFNGDFNLDGLINIDDYGLIDFAVPIQGIVL